MCFPYGIPDFRKIREGGYFHVDRTDRIWADRRGWRATAVPAPAPLWQELMAVGAGGLLRSGAGD
ncbi:MAG: hypothetical protein HC889_08015 [Synechococcaceae cyanobacterium SM1_2_3]|nr:hypothetical protein [Synechococcaceae cyanobacterium SM1_2_3]